ncbi:hypothetical protein D031_0525B, partial [Vibrio parahaemolyticus VP-48]
ANPVITIMNVKNAFWSSHKSPRSYR